MKRHPQLPVVIDHAAKPQLVQGWQAHWAGSWRRHLASLAGQPQVGCKLSRLLRTPAWTAHAGAVERADLKLLSYLGETRDEIDLLEEKVPRLLGLA